MNYIEGGGCHVTGKSCILGVGGRSANNKDSGCPLHGQFDVWILQNDDLLVSDIGFPSEEPKQCLALGITKALADQIARRKSIQVGTRVLTTQRTCLVCTKPFWMIEHATYSVMAQEGRSKLCPDCVEKRVDIPIQNMLESLRHWCG
jgi:hypothetical protein